MNTATIIAFIISLIIQVSLPLAVTLVFRRRTRAPWKLFGYGIVIYTVFQLVTWLPLSAYLDATLGSHLTSEWGSFLWLLAVALLTSLIEETGRWLGYKYLFSRHNYALSWENGMMYGLGHASMEAMLLIAGLTFVYFIAYIVLGRVNQGQLLGSLPPIEAQEVNSALADILNTTWIQPLVVAVERVMMLAHQLAWAIMVLASFIARRKRWFAFAVVYHFSIAVIIPGLAGLYGFWVAEGVNALFCALSLVIIIKLRMLLAEERLS